MTRKQLGSMVLVVSLISGGALIRAADEKNPNRSEPQTKAETVSQVYDIRDLTVPVQDFPLETSPHAGAFVSSVLRMGGQEAQSNPQGGTAGNNALFGGQGAAPAAGSARQEATDSVTKLLEDNVSPESWKDNGGTIGSLRELHGLLVVTQTPENQQKITVLLRQLAESHATMVRVTADWLLIGPADLQKLIKPPAGPDKRESAIQEIDPAALRNLPEKTRHFHAETLSFSGQTVHVVSGRVRSVVTSATPVVGTDVVAYSPEVAGVGGGIALQVTPRIDSDGQSAVVTLYSTFNDPDESGSLLPIVQGTSATTRPAGAGGQATGSFQPLNTVLQEMRTTVRLPLATPVLVGGMTLQPATKNSDPSQLVLILKVTATK